MGLEAVPAIIWAAIYAFAAIGLILALFTKPPVKFVGITILLCALTFFLVAAFVAYYPDIKAIWPYKSFEDSLKRHTISRLLSTAIVISVAVPVAYTVKNFFLYRVCVKSLSQNGALCPTQAKLD